MCGFGCGGGFYRSFLEDDEHRHHDHRSRRDYDDRQLEEEIRNMYAAGEISRSTYYDAMERLDRRLFSWRDLSNLKQQDHSMVKGVSTERVSTQTDREILKLESKKEELKRVREETLNIYVQIKRSVNDLKEEMSTAEKQAQEIVTTDENRARAFLRKRQELAEHVAALECRINELSSDLVQVDEAEKKLETQLLSLKALNQREKLTRTVNG